MQTDHLGVVNNGGIPNIIGWFGDGGRNTQADGKLFKLGITTPYQNRDYSGEQGSRFVHLNVGNYNAAYHRDDSQVIPKHLGVNMIIKY